MRSLVLVLNLIVSASLVIYSTDMYAASGHKHKSSVKSHRSKHKRGHGKHAARDPGNVWDRIRAGMRISKPMPPQAFSSLQHANVPSASTASNSVSANPVSADQQTANEKIQAELASKYTDLGRQHQILNRNRLTSPSVATAPLQNYTRYGRQRLNTTRSDLGAANATIAQSLQNRHGHLLQPSADYLTSGAQARTRIRTQLAPPSTSTPSSPDHMPNMSSEVSAKASDSSGYYTKKQHDTPPISPQADASTQLSGLEFKQSAREEEIWKRQALIYGRFKKQVNGYGQRPDYLQRVAERSQPYLYHIVEELSQHDMPMELALLPVVESAFQATALSPMSAAGIWQFIPSTGRDFNLVQNANYDARLDVAASTRAAVRFLYGLKSHFGDWLLALAAYNCGQGTVDAAISANRALGLGTDYWSLTLPTETMDYVPRLLAVAQIFSNPGAYGLKLSPIRNEPYFVKVKIDRKADIDYLIGKDLTEVAQMANLSYGQFCQLNPAYIQPKLTPNGPFTFLMPSSHASKLRDSLDSIAKFLGQPAPLPKNAPVNTQSIQEASLAVMPLDISVASQGEAMDTPKISSPFVSLDLSGKLKQKLQ